MRSIDAFATSQFGSSECLVNSITQVIASSPKGTFDFFWKVELLGLESANNSTAIFENIDSATWSDMTKGVAWGHNRAVNSLKNSPPDCFPRMTLIMRSIPQDRDSQDLALAIFL